jgi:flavodoxin
MKSLVVYYSRSGNTRFVAEQISEEIGADIEEIIDIKKRKGLLGLF